MVSLTRQAARAVLLLIGRLVYVLILTVVSLVARLLLLFAWLLHGLIWVLLTLVCPKMGLEELQNGRDLPAKK